MNMEHWWNLYRQVKIEVLGVQPSHCHFVHHKSHSDWAGVEDVIQAHTSKLVVCCIWGCGI